MMRLLTRTRSEKTSTEGEVRAREAPSALPDVESLFLDVNAFCAHVIKGVPSRRLRLRYVDVIRSLCRNVRSARSAVARSRVVVVVESAE